MLIQSRPETAIKIKHLFILIGLKDESPTYAANTRTNLRTIVDTFNECHNHFQTLKIRYWGEFGGEVEAVRHDLEGPLHPLIKERPPVMIRHATTGKFQAFRPKNYDTKLFKNTHILDSLKNFKNIADFVDIRGDIPAKNIAHLTDIIAVNDPGRPAKKAQRAKADAAKKQPKPNGGLQGFAAEMLAKKPNMDAESRKLYEDLMKTSRKSPAVMVSTLRTFDLICWRGVVLWTDTFNSKKISPNSTTAPCDRLVALLLLRVLHRLLLRPPRSAASASSTVSLSSVQFDLLRSADWERRCSCTPGPGDRCCVRLPTVHLGVLRVNSRTRWEGQLKWEMALLWISWQGAFKAMARVEICFRGLHQIVQLYPAGVVNPSS
jgi:hypothetical protein